MIPADAVNQPSFGDTVRVKGNAPEKYRRLLPGTGVATGFYKPADESDTETLCKVQTESGDTISIPAACLEKVKE